jgi:hypothetical protein
LLEFENTTIVALKDFIRSIHEDQERRGDMMYLRRLEPFLVSMEEYCKVIESAEVFVNPKETSGYLWVSHTIIV